jgi:dihydroneopterin aldolase
MGFCDRAAHHMALLAMEQYGCALASLLPGLALADSIQAFSRALREGALPVWLPTRMVLQAEDVPWSWEVTSDSLAAWLAGRIGASRLLLVKHERCPAAACVEDLVARGIVDPLFPGFLRKSGATASVVGQNEHDAVIAAIQSEALVGTRIDL